MNHKFKTKAYLSGCSKSQDSDLTYKMISDIDPELREDGKKNPFIRIFKNDVSDELWKAYCSALNITEDPDTIKSIRVYFTGAKPDRYNTAGEIDNL